MNLINKISRILLGLIFLLSGFSKAVNPFGMSVKVGEYLVAMGLDTFISLSACLSVLLISLEISLGFFLLIRFYPKITARIFAAVIFFFLVVTIWDFVSEPVGDCGCFGDVIKLSSGLSLLKNILLFLLVVLYICSLKTETTVYRGFVLPIFIVLFSLAFPLVVYFHLPLYDVSGFTEGDTLLEDGNSRIPMLRDDFTDISVDLLMTDDSILLYIIQNPDNIPDLSVFPLRTVALSAFDASSANVEWYSSDFSLLRQVMPNYVGGGLLVYKGQIIDKWASVDCPYDFCK